MFGSGLNALDTAISGVSRAFNFNERNARAAVVIAFRKPAKLVGVPADTYGKALSE
jgi:hypothetical protein